MATAAVAPQPATENNNNNNNNKSRQIPIVCPGHTRPLAELEFCHVKDEDRILLVSACHDKMPMMRDGTTGDWIGTFAGHKGAVWSCRLDPSGSLAATASGDFSVKVWDAITGNPLWHFTEAKHIVKTCDFSKNSTKLATGGHEGIVRIYDLRAPKKYPLEIPIPPGDGKAGITKCNWYTDELLLVAYSNGIIRVWKIQQQQQQREDQQNNQAPTVECVHKLTTEGSGSEIRDMELSYSVATAEDAAPMDILTVAAGQKVYFYSVIDYSLLRVYPMPIHFREEGGASLHPSGKKFVAGGSDLWVRVFDFQTGEQLECHKGHHGPIRCVRYSPNGTIYASGSEDGTIRLWKTDP